MTKVRSSVGSPKPSLHNPKNGSVQKKKQQKFKNTPTGKVALVNDAGGKANGKSPKNGIGKSPKHKKSSKSPKGEGKNGRSLSKSPLAKGKPSKIVAEESDDSDTDINEGVTIAEDVSSVGEEVDSEDSSDCPDIFGESLVDSSDDSDEDFEEEAKEKVSENKGVKMFKGFKSHEKSEEESSDEEDQENEEESDDDDDEEENAKNKSAPELKDLLGASMQDDTDDGDFEAEEDDSAEDDSEEESPSLNSSAVASTENDDDDTDDSEEDDEEIAEKSGLSLAALLGQSIVDDSDDEDFEGNEDDAEDDEDEDISDEEDDDEISGKSKKDEEDEDSEEIEDEMNESHESDDGKKGTPLTAEEKLDREKRTIFVGNIPKEIREARLKKEFNKFGPIATLRFRGIIPENPNMPLKVAAITKKFHPKSTTVCAFITYKNEDSVAQALEMNGKKLNGNYLRVDHANKETPADTKKSVFLGNLPFTVEDNAVWEAFKECGKIESVRIIRDRKTGLGRGFGYINFESADGAVLAMQLNGTQLENRELRVHVASTEGGKKRKSKSNQKTPGGSPKKFKADVSDDVKVATANSENAQRRKKKRSQGEKQRVSSSPTSPQNKSHGTFQGQKADAKKKQKGNKSTKQKKRMAEKLLSKPKKPAAK